MTARSNESIENQVMYTCDLKEFLKTSGALPVTGGRGGHYFGHGSASSVPLKPLFLKRLGDTGLPFSSGRHRNLPYLTFS